MGKRRAKDEKGERREEMTEWGGRPWHVEVTEEWHFIFGPVFLLKSV